MRWIAVFIVVTLQSIFLLGDGSIAHAQATGMDAQPPPAPRLSGPEASEPEHPSALRGASGGVSVFATQSDIDKRLPDRTGPNALAAEPLALPPPPLRDGPISAFVLTGVEISGVTAFPPQFFAPLYDDMLARAVTVQDVAELVDAITNAYRSRGYFLSRAIAPAQTGHSGLLRIQVFEGFIESVTIDGGDVPVIKQQLRDVTAERPLKLATLERALALIGDLKGISVESTEITPDPTDLARHRLSIDIKSDDFEAGVYADNRGIDAAGPVQAYLSAAANSIFTWGDQLSVGLFTIPDDPGELALAEIAYQAPISGTGAYVKVSAMGSRFDAGASLAALDTETRTRRLSVSISYPVIRTRKTVLWTNIGLEGRNIEEQQLGAPVFEDKLRVISAWTNYRSDHWNGYTTVFGKVSRGLDMLGASVGQASLSRPDADGEFTKFEAQISRYQNVGDDFGVYTSLWGQTSLDPLLASEEFALGGARFGRAYDYGELTGEEGIAVLAELRYGRNPNLPFLDFYQLYGFYDHGVVWNDNVAPGSDKQSLSSAGGGIRLTFPDVLYATIEAAKPLDRAPFTQGDQDWRLFLSVSKSF
jgi:hemolysin activation/secretion protein